MKLSTFIFFAFLSFSVLAQQGNPYLQLKFDTVVMYDYIPNVEKAGTIINSKGKLIATVVKQIRLDSLTINQINKRIGQKKSYGGTTAFCFDPHLGIVYYLDKKVVAHISICFSCNKLYSSIEIPAQKQGKVGKGKDAYYIANGLSKNFRSFLNTLAKQYAFSHQIEPESIFDQ